MGVGEGIGSDGPGGRDWRREGERGKRRRERGEEEVRTGGFLFLFCLNKRLRGFLSPFFLLLGFLDGCCLVMCSPSLLLSLSSVGRRCLLLLPPSRSLAFSLLWGREWNDLLLNYMHGQEDLLTSGLFILSLLCWSFLLSPRRPLLSPSISRFLSLYFPPPSTLIRINRNKIK